MLQQKCHGGDNLAVIAALDRSFDNSRQACDTISPMTSTEDIKRRIIELEVEHRDLDAVIETLARDTRHEELQLRRLKKRKLQLKDHITLLKMQLIPDIPA